jgi:hypothetical protein
MSGSFIKGKEEEHFKINLLFSHFFYGETKKFREGGGGGGGDPSIWIILKWVKTAF